MHIDQKKEQFSVAYLHAVASVAGFATYRPSVDDDSIDWGLAAKQHGHVRSPRLELQLKCTHVDDFDGAELKFELKVKNYNDLVPDNVLVPRILAVVVVPENEDDWLNHSDQQLLVRRCGYWVSLRGQPTSANERSVVVRLPAANLLSPEGLTNIMTRIGAGGLP